MSKQHDSSLTRRFATESDQAVRCLLRCIVTLSEQGLATIDKHQVPLSVKKGISRFANAIWEIENSIVSFKTREHRRQEAKDVATETQAPVGVDELDESSGTGVPQGVLGEGEVSP